MAIRTTFYIDGFNFYYGLRAAVYQLDSCWKNFYWLDLVKFAEQFLAPSHQLVAVKYFTSSPLEEQKEKRQSALFKANKYLNGNKVEFIKGKYCRKRIKCLAECGKYFEIHEEKRTDVNISVEIIGDCAFDKTDHIVLISADSDLVPTIEYVLKNYPEKRLTVYFPPCRKSNDILSLMKKVVFLETNRLKFEKAVMPDMVVVGDEKVTIPEKWKSDFETEAAPSLTQA